MGRQLLGCSYGILWMLKQPPGSVSQPLSALQRTQRALSIKDVNSSFSSTNQESSFLFLFPRECPLGNMKLISLFIISLKDGLINVEDRVEDRAGPLPDSPMQAHLASQESLGSLMFTSEEAQLATSESLSLLSSASSQVQLATGESLSDLPSTSEQTLPDCTIHFHGFLTNDSIIPIKIRSHSDALGDEDSEESLSSEESYGHGGSPTGRLKLQISQRCVREASWDIDKIESLQDDISIKSSWLGLDEQRKGDADSIWSLTDEELMACDQEKDSSSSSESEESCSPSPGCSFNEGLSFQLFNPNRVPKVDRWSRFLFPLSFGLFNVVYWLYHIY